MFGIPVATDMASGVKVNHFVIIYLASKLYKILKVALPTAISLISTKKCNKIISHTRRFAFFLIHSESKG